MQPSTSPAFARRRPSALHVDGAGSQRTTVTTTFSSVDRLLADIAFQRQRERQRVAVTGRQSRRRREDGQLEAATSTTDEAVTKAGVTATGSELDDEAASAYWWTDVFLRYFVFDEDCTKTATTADSDDLLFFVRRRRSKRKYIKRRLSSQRQRLVTYDTRAYRKQQHNQQQQQQQQQKPTMLPIGDPAVLWRHTVCLNTIVHRLRYTLTVAVCTRVPRKAAASSCFSSYDGSKAFLSADGKEDCEFDLQLLSRHVHTVYASTSGRRMDAAKGPRERPVYPAVCWAVDDFAEAFRTVVVRPGQTVCTELVAAWPGTATVVEEYLNNDIEDDSDNDKYDVDGSNSNLFGPHKSVPVKEQQNLNKVVLFTGAVPYAAVRATYECKMSLYREAQRQRRKRRRQQQRKRIGKKSSLGAALSASLTALFVGGKESATLSDCGDNGYYYGSTSSINATVADADRIEFVTVRGCQPSYDNDDNGDGELSSDDENHDADDFDYGDISVDGDDLYDYTKGLAQMAVTLAPTQKMETITSDVDGNSEHHIHYHHHHHHQQYCRGEEYDNGDTGYDHDPDFTASAYYDHTNNDYVPAIGYQKQQLESYTRTTTASEPGDFYEYGWDYETATSSEQQTPQTPTYYYQQQQQQQLERQQRKDGRLRRLSDPCSTSVLDQSDDDDRHIVQHHQNYQQQHEINNYNSVCGKKNWRKKHVYKHRLQQQPNSYGSVKGLTSIALTPGRSGRMQHPHRAWSESDGLDQCGGSLAQQYRNLQKPQLLSPPPIPYYCAAEAAVSGFVQYVHKSPSGWWARTKNKRRRRCYRSVRRKPSEKTTSTVDCRRSSSAGGNGYTITDDENSGGSGSGSNSDHGGSNSDEQDSDGEFIGMLAAAAAFGQDPDREWSQRGNAGDPVADWDKYDCESDSSVEPEDDDMVEWTTEIMATDMRRKKSHQNSIPARIVHDVHDNYLHFCDAQSLTPVFTNRQLHHQSRQEFIGHQHQFHRPLPQFRPQPLEPAPPPPALSVAFTAVACPWWTVLEDVLHVNAKTSGDQSSSNKTDTFLPLLTFD